MDTELARTFLAIVSTGSFVRAAERLNVGQTTVSARIRSLEEQLGRPLFVRNKGGAVLTAAGELFLRHAPTFVQVWQRVKDEIAVPEGHRAVLTMGSEVALWNPLLLEWMQWMRRTHGDLALRIHIDVPQDLLNLVATAVVDIAIMYAPSPRSGIRIDLLTEETLVLVSTDPQARTIEPSNYIFVDWGPDFAQQHDMSYPDLASSLQANLGPFALEHILSAGGSGYFRSRVVQPHVQAGRLHLIPGMPHFSYPVYAVYSENSDAEIIADALSGLHNIIDSGSRG